MWDNLNNLTVLHLALEAAVDIILAFLCLNCACHLESPLSLSKFWLLGSGCQVLRILKQRYVQKAIFFGAVISIFRIIWTLYNLVGSKTPFFEDHEHDTRHFQQEWCRMQGWRVDWETMAKSCAGKVAWDERKENSEWRTDASNSFIKKWEIQPAGR